MARDALERLFNDVTRHQNLDKSQYSLDEQIEADEGEFLDAMSEESKNVFLSRVQKVELEDDEEEEIIEEENEEPLDEEDYEEEEIEEEVEEQPKRGRGRPRKTPVEEQPVEQVYTEVPKQQNINSMNEFMDSLAKDLIEDLKKSNYQTRNYSKEQMLVILNYIKEKI